MIFANRNFNLPGASGNNNMNVIGLPLINKDKSSLMKEVELLPYKIDMIICKNFNNNTKKYVKITSENANNANNANNVTNNSISSNQQIGINKVNIFDIINKVPTKKIPNSFIEDTVAIIPIKETKQYLNNGVRNNMSNKKMNQSSPSERIFIVKPDIQNDIYHLYTSNNNKEEYYDTAYIPTYTTSVMMNKLFRNIKENENLDKLEESDDEDEFENNNIDKFVYLEKSYTMICKYNYKFKKWFPVSVVKK